MSLAIFFSLRKYLAGDSGESHWPSLGLSISDSPGILWFGTYPSCNLIFQAVRNQMGHWNPAQYPGRRSVHVPGNLGIVCIRFHDFRQVHAGGLFHGFKKLAMTTGTLPATVPIPLSVSPLLPMMAILSIGQGLCNPACDFRKHLIIISAMAALLYFW